MGLEIEYPIKSHSIRIVGVRIIGITPHSTKFIVQVSKFTGISSKNFGQHSDWLKSRQFGTNIPPLLLSFCDFSCTEYQTDRMALQGGEYPCLEDSIRQKYLISVSNFQWLGFDHPYSAPISSKEPDMHTSMLILLSYSSNHSDWSSMLLSNKIHRMGLGSIRPSPTAFFSRSVHIFGLFL